jgi:hypothetical protein
MEMTLTAQHQRHGYAGRPGKLINDDKEEILARYQKSSPEPSSYRPVNHFANDSLRNIPRKPDYYI